MESMTRAGILIEHVLFTEPVATLAGRVLMARYLV
jgi:geranylgeranyl pyrophosphate synthase